MASKVSICNLALSNIGKDNIQALTDANAEARACNQFYDHTVDLLLSAYPWKFAGLTQSLAEVANDKESAWRHAYQRPTGCLEVRCVRPTYSTSDDVCAGSLIPPSPQGWPYEIEGQTIYCDLSPAFLRFTQRLTDPSKFPPLFVDALAWHLAVRLAMPLTRDPKVRADAFQLAMQTQDAATIKDANEVRETSDITSDFVTAREDGCAGNPNDQWKR